MSIDTCICCGEHVPEGRQVCQRCELIGPKELLLILKREAQRREMDERPVHGVLEKKKL